LCIVGAVPLPVGGSEQIGVELCATASQVGKFDREAAASQFVKPIPYEELQREIDIFCELFTQPAVEKGSRKFVESTDAQPYLP
jgi:hypothetical protein